LLLRTNSDPRLGPPRLAHLKAHEYTLYNYLTREQFNSYFKFSFVRNPWDRMISIYKHSGYSKRCGFKEYIFGDFMKMHWKHRHWFVGQQAGFLYDENGGKLVDYVGRFENLQEDFDHVCKQIGIPLATVPHANKSKNETTSSGQITGQGAEQSRQESGMQGVDIPYYRTYMEYYDSESKEFVAELYKQDIELFGYKF
jgi:hypothetical protein